MKTRALLAVALASLVLALASVIPLQSLFAQGNLAPPGTPAPTMKSLDQVEPRIIINATNTPGNATNVFRITAPGSYYLTGNVAGVGGKSGIEINSDNVTIDLNGFTLQGAGSGHGIKTPDLNLNRIVIRNGFIKGFAGNGIDLNGDGFADGTLIERVHCSNNGGSGFVVGGAVLRACTATSNGQRGINVDLAGCAITDCVANSNGDIGIFAQDGSTVSGCSAHGNGGDGFNMSNSTLKSSAARKNDGNGIFAVDAVVSECASIENETNGIAASTRSKIVGNVISQNTLAGINTVGVNAVIEGNLVSQNAIGLDVDTVNNYIRNNTVVANPDNYAIVAGNHVEILLSQIPETIDFGAKVILPGDLTGVAGSNGILVMSDNVTIDLAGHALIGVAGSLDGVLVSGVRANICICNGTVRNWAGDGVDTSSATGGSATDLLLHNNVIGLRAGTEMMISKVISRGNSNTGILAEVACKVMECTASTNGSNGIAVGDASSVERCNVFDNAGNGIVVSNTARIVDNLCDLHNEAGMAGILVNSDRNRIEGNTLTRNTVGLSVIATGNFNVIVRNSASGNTGGNHYIITGTNNDVGPLGAAATATSPWANLQN